MKRNLEALLNYTKQDGECLVWTRCFNTDGYPRAVIDGDNNAKVHRIVYELANGVSAEGLVVRHTCDNPKCINPNHLLLGTFGDNAHDKFVRNRQPRKITKEIVYAINAIKASDSGMSQKEIANLFKINHRRVSDIYTGKYCSATGKFLGHG